MKRTEAQKARRRELYAANREQRLRQYHDWWIKNRDEHLARRRELYATTPGRKEAGRRWTAEHKEAEAERLRRYREEHPERARNSQRKYWKANPAKCAESARAWKESCPDTIRLYTATRRARERKAPGGGVSPKAWAALKDLFGHRCAYCFNISPLTIEHVDPISKGGAHDTENVVPACSRCNCSKSDETLIFWLARGGLAA